jgi:phosphocarrier protein HPr
LIERTATIASRSGLHAGPAAIFARAAAELPVEISIALSADPTDDCDATSILSLMSLGAGYGDQVTLRAESADAAGSLDRLVELLETDLDA